MGCRGATGGHRNDSERHPQCSACSLILTHIGRHPIEDRYQDSTSSTKTSGRAHIGLGSLATRSTGHGCHGDVRRVALRPQEPRRDLRFYGISDTIPYSPLIKRTCRPASCIVLGMVQFFTCWTPFGVVTFFFFLLVWRRPLRREANRRPARWGSHPHIGMSVVSRLYGLCVSCFSAI